MRLQVSLPDLGLTYAEIELLALAHLPEEDYDHKRGLITREGLGLLVEILQEVLDGD